MLQKYTFKEGGNWKSSRKNLLSIEENWMIFFIERLIFGGLEIFLKIQN
jgi:hypothetical protein